MRVANDNGRAAARGRSASRALWRRALTATAAASRGALWWRRAVLLALLAVSPLTIPALGALESSATIRTLLNLYSSPLSDWHINGVAEGLLDLRSERNRVVRAHLQLKTTLISSQLGVAGTVIPASALPAICSGESAVGRLCLDVPRANVRVRIPITDDYRLRFTIGRARLTWGQGQLFNAGDLLFGANATQVDYTQGTLRDETAVLLAAFIPITDFTFIETVVLPPLTILTDAPVADSAAGLRLQGKIVDWKYEVGYLYNGDEGAHNISLNLQGNLGADIYLSATSALLHNVDDLADEFYRRLQITLGISYAANLGNDLGLNVRLESLWRPAATWTEEDGATVRYALLLYPEVSLAIRGTVQLFVRSLFSPIDLSAQIIGGVSWQPYTGLSLLFFPSINVGQKTDSFYLDQNGGIRLSLGASYTF